MTRAELLDDVKTQLVLRNPKNRYVQESDTVAMTEVNPHLIVEIYSKRWGVQLPFFTADSKAHVGDLVDHLLGAREAAGIS